MKNIIPILLIIIVGCASHGHIENNRFVNESCPYTFEIPTGWHEIHHYPGWIGYDGFAESGIFLRLQNAGNDGVIIAIYKMFDISLKAAVDEEFEHIYKDEYDIKTDSISKGFTSSYEYMINTDGMIAVKNGSRKPTLVVSREIQYAEGVKFKTPIYEINRAYFIPCHGGKTCLIQICLFTKPDRLKENVDVLERIRPSVRRPNSDHFQVKIRD